MPLVTTERSGHVLTISLNRDEKLNAFNYPMLRELAEAYTELAQDKTLRVGVLRANGRYFTSGLDLGELFPELYKEAIAKAIPFFEPVKGLVPKGGVDPFGITTDPCPKPIVSAVEGRVFTLGIELLLAASINVASTSASFTQYEVSRGLFPFGGGTVRWPLAVGTHNANRWTLTGEEFGAEEAYRIGLIQELVEVGKADEKAHELANTIARQAPLGVQTVLRNGRIAQNKGASTALAKTRSEFVKILMSKDIRRGFAAFKKREEAVFEGD
ncbi:crotonase/enoyl-CoA hydratase family protein [Smaragdicoccus niigatensis]|uniref:crotonase/enoyl-CoA hydratase family protein n=1 Tax=Smaragdicoccus niigatensis TaxID=359359 RepID=UPI0003737044|nr:crotonase/enoyl-CoA hydratase family protein [Smaragdicoccus niigatensis]